jgi:hypothetical protein
MYIFALLQDVFQFHYQRDKFFQEIVQKLK